MIIKHLRKESINKDVYILGSGASLNYFNPSPQFWYNKIVIGINTIFELYPCDYTIIQHHELTEYILEKYPGDRLIISRYHKGIRNDSIVREIKPWLKKWCWIYEHNDQPFLKPLNFSALDDPNKLVVGSTTAIAAISFAYHIGAKNIFLCGIDGGSLNGETNVKGYYQSENAGNKAVQHNHSVQTNNQIFDFRNELRRRGVNMYSINPFVNMNFEGNQFSINN
jgi:hypothetical protein